MRAVSNQERVTLGSIMFGLGQNVLLAWSKFWPILANQETLTDFHGNDAKKNSWIGPWISSIDWCQGHWCGSIYMVVRLSDVSSKAGKKCIFCVFRLFLRIGSFENLSLFESAILKFPWKSVKVSWLARLGPNFNQDKRANTFWPSIMVRVWYTA